MSQNKNKLELYVCSLFEEVYHKTRPTKASGACNELGDVNQPYFVIECKQRSTKNVSILLNTWNKLIKSIPFKSLRKPLLILENQNKKRFAIMELEDWFKMFKESINNNENK